MAYPEDNFKGAAGNRGKPSRGAGRKPKLVRKWVKECNVSKTDAQNMLKQVLFTMTADEINKLREAASDKVSVATFSLLTAMENAAKRGDFSIIKQMFEFCYGRDDQTITVKDDSRLVDLKNLLLDKAGQSPEEKDKIIAELDKLTSDEK
jgi:hypothetical protein